jgi:hypothetical protein
MKYVARAQCAVNWTAIAPGKIDIMLKHLSGRLRSNMSSSELIKLLHHFESDQVYDFWLVQPKIILI